MKCASATTVSHVVQPDLVRGHAGRLWSGAVSGRRYATGGAFVSGSPHGSLYGGHGTVAAA